MRAVPSVLAVASRVPSGLKSANSTIPLWPLTAISSSPDVASHICTSRSSPVVAKRVPEFEHHNHRALRTQEPTAAKAGDVLRVHFHRDAELQEGEVANVIADVLDQADFRVVDSLAAQVDDLPFLVCHDLRGGARLVGIGESLGCGLGGGPLP